MLNKLHLKNNQAPISVSKHTQLNKHEPIEPMSHQKPHRYTTHIGETLIVAFSLGRKIMFFVTLDHLIDQIAYSIPTTSPKTNNCRF